MSWSDIYPILTDEMLQEYAERVSSADCAELDLAFGLKKVINARASKQLIVTSLFWKNPSADQDDLPPITRELMQNAAEHGLVSRHEPWEHYVVPLIAGAKKLQEERPDVVLRVYLAADMEFLVDDLVASGCEVALMQGSSLRHNPGAMWRFLALEEAERWVTVIDSDQAPEMQTSLERTELMMASGLGLWRQPYVFDTSKSLHPGQYRPMIASHFGAKGGQPMEQLMRAFLWHTQRATMANECVLSAGKQEPLKTPIFGTLWPTYGFDEWFLLAAYYPRMAYEGVLTFYKFGSNLGPWFALDVEYAAWANPLSETLFYGDLQDYEKLLHPSDTSNVDELSACAPGCCKHEH